ncbi:UDP-N-acetylmuramate--alanine ligase [Pseudonocardia sp. Ae168_Ps1]|uniref:UDP-N-acetylmuramate--L-alanine ligase n=1 Tax=unclassified Pseudonocardia TaxID=2619320 RepID=UPI00094B3DDF|nr:MULTISPECIES: UDP-N-acetylmuramate--L-alanine ligase [unclassified Pseudonocardia]OLL71222.1 UDP-N-acetylmuramate--alanine ligase [Pseudonocardia sp. Ae168_Ps1]OLL77225.1 UDP-N-acetylmuramate--alanine ligase [Pseudonocardia sp. Ae150A_Ps1]OLL88666.1 UDP-N-acetylmuramate--alanine ligase [Pseudonocardia sp. Ae263_Ps1]OLL91313.1 UDP-N-acetylmuramate--alanine ligase [Pseudonocardia sp. Ae356_Ps1]
MSGVDTALGRHVHLIGIGGAGMSGIARILLARGITVSGSDARESRTVTALRALGARVEVGHDAAHLRHDGEDPPTVVVSTAIRETNPELAAAREQGLQVVHRAVALAALTEGRRLVAVAGTHGKTSTTSMVTVALQHTGADPSFAIGGDLSVSGSGAHHGSGDVFVVEADESDGSFTAFAPSVAVVTNVEPDHLDHHGDEATYRAVFERFLERLVPGATLVTCADDPGSELVAVHAERAGTTVRRYGRTATGSQDARLLDFAPDGVGSRTRFRWGGEEHELVLGVPGEHMALNALGAFLAGTAVDQDPATLLEGLAGFGGVQRRFEFKGRVRGVAVYDDYAHHPTEVAATLRAAREAAPVVQGRRGRVLVAFQPHLYSRTRLFAGEFGASLSLADEVMVLDVYGAREDPEPGVGPALITDQVRLPAERVHRAPSWEKTPAAIAALAADGDTVITMGAGDITALGPEILRELAVGDDGA